MIKPGVVQPYSKALAGSVSEATAARITSVGTRDTRINAAQNTVKPQDTVEDDIARFTAEQVDGSTRGSSHGHGGS